MATDYAQTLGLEKNANDTHEFIEYTALKKHLSNLDIEGILIRMAQEALCKRAALATSQPFFDGSSPRRSTFS